MNANVVSEIFWLRALSCLSIVLIHSINFGMNNYPDSAVVPAAEMLKAFLLFATPTFVFISEFLNAKAYRDGTPRGFLLKRAKILLFPYIILGMVYPFLSNVQLTGVKTYIIESAKNIIFGDFIAYFILIILQFHILHVLFANMLSMASPRMILTVAFLINFVYLAAFNLTDPVSGVPFSGYIWNRGYFMLFPGWIFYFALGYYCGAHYDILKSNLHKYRVIVLLAPILTFLLSVSILNYTGIDLSSKRFDNILFSTSMIFLLMYITSKLKNVPRFIYLISNYSFSIYLLHLAFILVLRPLPIMGAIAYIIYLFVTAIAGSILLAAILNRFPFGKYIVGNVQTRGKSKKKERLSIPNTIG
ncbi:MULTISPECIES: acyltransferase family protein [unclassified Paenibacillus]|uniref:acyltransferase family protein n=1 Tax=Paenibacillus TaxID=44249 RepID=UPI0021176C36|nr:MULTISPECIES: acyltransferase family protein [unclassified Paenibacillus]